MPHCLQIRQVALVVSDVEQALGFYRDLLGIPFLFQPADNLAFLETNGVRLMLSTPQGAGAIGANSVLYFTVKNLETTHKEIVAAGATEERLPQMAAEMPDHQLWISFLKDPDGNLVGLMEEKPKC